MESASGAEMCVAAANRKPRSVWERLFPPTWVEALRCLKAIHSDPTAFAPSPADLLHELLVPTPSAMHGDNPEEDFHTWFFQRHEFGKLLCLYDAMSSVATALNLCDPAEPDFNEWFEVAARILDTSEDGRIAMICMEAAAKV